MPRPSPYTAEQKTSIIEAAIAAKAAGNWNDALSAAKDAGYTGKVAYLKLLIRGTKPSKAAKKAQAKRRRSEAEAAVMELQNAPATVARDEALHASDALQLVRKHKTSGEVEPRPRGRQHTDYEYGYISGGNHATFRAGDPPKAKKGKGGRPKGSKNKITKAAAGAPPAKAARPVALKVNGLGAIEQIVQREVEARLRAAKAAALKAFNSALGV